MCFQANFRVYNSHSKKNRDTFLCAKAQLIPIQILSWNNVVHDFSFFFLRPTFGFLIHTASQVKTKLQHPALAGQIDQQHTGPNSIHIVSVSLSPPPWHLQPSRADIMCTEISYNTCSTSVYRKPGYASHPLSDRLDWSLGGSRVHPVSHQTPI